MQKAVDHIRKSGIKTKRIAAEFGFLPYDAAQRLRAAFPDADWVDALYVLERQRVKKSPEELQMLKHASEAVIDSMQAVIAKTPPGTTKADIVEALRREETNRGLTFEYCLITVGTSHNRAPSEQKWEQGEILSLDSGGNYHGYIGDLCRMAIQRRAGCRTRGSARRDREHPARRLQADPRRRAWARRFMPPPTPLVQKSKHHNHLEFLAHGMGLVSHEGAAARRARAGALSGRHTRDEPLEAGMVVSVETTLLHPARLHQARGHRGRDRRRPRDLRRRPARLEQGGHGLRPRVPAQAGRPSARRSAREQCNYDCCDSPACYDAGMSGDFTASLSRRSPPPSRATAAPPSPGSRTAPAA